jgi:hypothetical protein
MNQETPGMNPSPQWGLLNVAMLRMTVALTILFTSCGMDAPRYYLLSPIAGVAAVNVHQNGHVEGKIVDRRRVAAILSFLNARRNHWFDPKGGIFATTDDLELVDSKGKQIAWISFGGGGMYQSRPTMTYADSVGRKEFIVVRVGSPSETQRDADTLCGLLGGKFDDESCVR